MSSSACAAPVSDAPLTVQPKALPGDRGHTAGAGELLPDVTHEVGGLLQLLEHVLAGDPLPSVAPGSHLAEGYPHPHPAADEATADSWADTLPCEPEQHDEAPLSHAACMLELAECKESLKVCDGHFWNATRKRRDMACDPAFSCAVRTWLKVLDVLSLVFKPGSGAWSTSTHENALRSPLQTLTIS